ncbi:hypothetical protein HDE_07043 [Halotydeus destructor]|nr:hypothetical protein HDE_07043 [Halotydeus destructor]
MAATVQLCPGSLCPINISKRPPNVLRTFFVLLTLSLLWSPKWATGQRRPPGLQLGSKGTVSPQSLLPGPGDYGEPQVNEKAHRITFGAILPTTALITVRRQYYKRISDSVENLMRGRQGKFNFTNHFRISQAQVVLVSLNPSPTEVLSTLCQQLLVKDVSTVIYMTNSDVYGHNAASAQYLMQLTGYLGIPMIAWNADNIGLEQVRHCDTKIESRDSVFASPLPFVGLAEFRSRRSDGHTGLR